MRHLNTILLIILFTSCSSNQKKEKTESYLQEESRSEINNKSLNNFDKPKPEIFLIKQSECVENCNKENLISKEYFGDTLLLKFISIQNCAGKFDIDYKIDNETLDIQIDIKKTIVKRKNGSSDTLITIAFCDCYYNFEIGLKHIDKKFTTILVNGEKLNKTLWPEEDE